jgi:hypothetical protein
MKKKPKILTKRDKAIQFLRDEKSLFTKLKEQFKGKKKTLKYKAYVSLLAMLEDRLHQRIMATEQMPEDQIADTHMVQEPIYGEIHEFFMKELEKSRP